MDAVDMLRETVKECHGWLEETMSNVTEEEADWRPPDLANPIGAVYAHAVIDVDMGFNMWIRRRSPLIATDWAGRAGLSEPHAPPPWHDWAARVRVDLEAFRRYARAVYADVDDYLASLSAGDLDQEIDMSVLGEGRRTVGQVITSVAVRHISGHCGEIACLKGLQGRRGYPPLPLDSD